jgi:TolB-like protein
MMSLANYFDKIIVLFLLVGLFNPSGCATQKEVEGEVVRPNLPAGREAFQIAVLPVENVSATAAPLEAMKQSLIAKLKGRRVAILPDDALERFVVKERIRYIGGLDQKRAEAFRTETGSKAVLILSLELYNDANPPKVALISRLVSTGDQPTILWADGVGLAGDDSPGIVDLGLIESPQILLDKALESLSDSLVDYFANRRKEATTPRFRKKFRPKTYYRSPLLSPDRKYSVAVVPFLNKSERKNAGEIMMLHFVKQLQHFENFDVVEPGVVRQELLALRVIMDQGVSLTQTDAILGSLNADLVLTGEVLDYEDPRVNWGTPKVNFSAQFIEKKSRKIIWSSASFNQGDDGVFFFDRGRVNTAHVMASEMVKAIGSLMGPKGH